VSGEVWGPAILAGVLGLASILLLQRIMSRLATLPQQEHPDIAQYPLLTVFLWLLTGGLVAGVAEEVSFRGFMQKPIEQRHGPVVAILITGILFGFAHFTHPEVTFILLPYYIAVAAVYGALAYFTNSIYPSMILHAGGNVLGSLDLFSQSRSEWQASNTPTPLVWETGTDAGFWLSLLAFLVVGALTVLAYAGLRKVSRGSAESI
jgi:membrane protease YdiL (CAAX protease family)